MKTILFVARGIGYGGASKQLAITANNLSKSGNNIYVYSYNLTYTDQLFDDKVIFIPSQKERNNSILEYLICPLNIRKKIKLIKPDIIIAFRANAGCFSKIASYGLNVKIIYSERTDPYTETNLLLKIATKICDLCDGGVFQTDKARHFYKKLSPKSVTIPNPFVINNNLKIKSYESRKKEIVFVGRFFLVQKRQDIALKAFKLIHERKQDFILRFIGGGDDMTKIKKLAEKMNLLDCVKFSGVVKDVVENISESSLLILTSDYEGIPNVLLEAMSVGVPVVSTDASPGGVRVIINDNFNGNIVPCGNYRAIAYASLKILDNPQIAIKYISNGLLKVKEFDSDIILGKWNSYLSKQ